MRRKKNPLEERRHASNHAIHLGVVYDSAHLHLEK